MEQIKSYFTNAGFNPLDSEIIVSHFKRKLFNKDDFFVKEGRKSLQLAYLESGQFQYYTTMNNGDEKTTYISLENTFIASLLSYLTEIPARENIRAISKATLWIIDKKDVVELQKQMQNFKDFYIKLIEWQICCIDKSRLDLITLSAEQRYTKLLNEEPELLQQVPLQYIASMLGITPRHLSRLRAKM